MGSAPGTHSIVAEMPIPVDPSRIRSIPLSLSQFGSRLEAVRVITPNRTRMHTDLHGFFHWLGEWFLVEDPTSWCRDRMPVDRRF